MFNPDDYEDPFPEEILAAAKTKREKGELANGSFFTLEDASTTADA